MKNTSIQYEKKFTNFILPELSNVDQPSILEFGVRYGVSTNLFLDICEKKNGFLHSVDMEDFSNAAKSDKWKFHLSRDDNFDYLEKVLPAKFDMIYLDSFHNADHIEKIFYYYYRKLKVGGIFVFDDISWVPYLKNKERNNFNCEINNQETFDRIVNIFSNNDENFELSFYFLGSGSAKVKKISEKDLFKNKKIIYRKNSLKNIIRKNVSFFKKIFS